MKVSQMKTEKSCGMVIFTQLANEHKYVLVQSKNGQFGFPKGHIEIGETEKETARREVWEEVRLIPKFLAGFREISEYFIPSINVKKQVVFFLGYYQSQEIIIQEAELKGAFLVSFKEAMDLLVYENDKKILAKAELFLCDKDER